LRIYCIIGEDVGDTMHRTDFTLGRTVILGMKVRAQTNMPVNK
jgi:hypothetical protein